MTYFLGFKVAMNFLMKALRFVPAAFTASLSSAYSSVLT